MIKSPAPFLGALWRRASADKVEMEEIYLDNCATTRSAPEVIAAMADALGDGFGNASSTHGRGVEASRRVDEAARRICEAVGGTWRVVFTSGGTEADNLAVLGTVPRGKRDAVITTTMEHAAVEEACQAVEQRGGRHVTVGGGVFGVVSPEQVLSALDEKTALVSIIHVASEMGTVQPVAEIARAVKATRPRCRVHVDAVQALAQLPLLDYPPEIDMVSVSAHKIHGPQGVGALLLRPNVRPRSLFFGGDQQDGIRPGTLNVPGIAGMGLAARLHVGRRSEAAARMRTLCDRLIDGLTSRVEGARLLGSPALRAPGIAVMAVTGLRSQTLLHGLEMHGVLASAGSACHARRSSPPRCLVDAGLRDDEASVRLSLSFDTTSAQIDEAVLRFEETVRALRGKKAWRTLK